MKSNYKLSIAMLAGAALGAQRPKDFMPKRSRSLMLSQRTM